jgi:hypothetical protein
LPDSAEGNQALSAKLQSAGLAPQTLRPVLRKNGSAIWGFDVTRQTALAEWQRYRDRLEETGFYPLIMTGRILSELEADWLSGADPSAENLRLAEGISAKAWLDERFAELEGIGDCEDNGEDSDESDGLLSLDRNAPGSTGPFALLLMPTRDPWAVFAYLDYGGWNAYPDATEHVAVMKHWYLEHGAEPVLVSGDVIEMIVKHPVTSDEECRRLAAEQAAYTAGDLVYQGVGSLGSLTRVLKNRKYWFFWWD